MLNVLKRNLKYKNINLLNLNGTKMTKINVYQTGNFCSKQGSKTKEEETKGDNPNENKTNTEDDFNEDESQANYKTSRKIRFIVGKCFKYFFIFGGLVTLYNAYLYKRKSKPEEHLLYNRYSYAIVSKISYFWRLIYGVSISRIMLELDSSLQ